MVRIVIYVDVRCGGFLKPAFAATKWGNIYSWYRRLYSSLSLYYIFFFNSDNCSGHFTSIHASAFVHFLSISRKVFIWKKL